MYKSNYNILLDKLDEFIRKYYKNLLIRGLIYGTAVFVAFLISISVLEYFGHFSTSIRTFLFYSFFITNGAVFIWLILIPIAKLYKLGSIISHEQAASIIGKHFSEVQDRLINVLQLQKQQSLSENPQSADLIEAGINQKIKELKPIPFTSAVDFSGNKKYLKFAAIPLLIFFIILFANRNIITGSTTRIIDHRTYFEKPSPFQFTVLNKNLNVVQQEDFTLDLKVSGSELPNVVFVDIDGNQYKMEKDNALAFHHVFKNVQRDITFKISAEGFSSKEYELTALPNPVILAFNVKLEYPSYLRKQNEELHNTGDLTIPEGTKVSWIFNTRNTDGINIGFSDSLIAPSRHGSSQFEFSKRFFRNDMYSVVSYNQFLKNKDSITYSVSVIPDLYPTINVEQKEDSFSSKKIFFKGLIKDDYGFSRLVFHSKLLNKKDSTSSSPERNIAINKDVTEQNFYFFWNMEELNVAAGDEMEYFFEIWDNDGVRGPKSSRSQTMVFKAPTAREIANSSEKKNDEIKDQMKEGLQAARAIQKDLAELEKKMIDKKSISWEDKKKAQDLLDRQKDLQKKVEQIQKENEKNVNKQAEFKEPNPELAAKHEELKKLMEQLMTDEMKKLMENLEKMMSQLDKQKLQDQVDKMKLTNKDVEKELARALELFKNLEVEQKLKEITDNLKSLAQKQSDLSEQSKDKNADSKDLQKKQDELNKEFKELQKDLGELDKKNAALEQPQDLGNTTKDQEDIQQDMQSSSEQLSKNKKQGASGSQKNAADKMEKLAQKLDQAQSDEEDEQTEEDINSLRALLENLLKLSFDQEKLMGEMNNISTNNPRYLKMAQTQRKLKDDAKMIEDSLFALSKRVVEIQSIVNREIALVNDNMDKSIGFFQERMVYQVREKQQMVMTSTNNLALLLSEVLDQLQEKKQDKESEKQSKNKSNSKSKCKKPGSACSKPGKGKPSSAAQMRKMQEALNKQMEALQKSLKEGKKPGDNAVPGQQGMSQQLAKMAAQQEMLRNELQRFNNENNKDGKGTLGNLDKTARDMEETESDLVNKIISNETLKRQQDILTRLLEAETAERERDWDDKRESKEGKNEIVRNPDEFEAYKRLKEKELELLKTVPPSLSPYYKKKVDEYFRNIEN